MLSQLIRFEFATKGVSSQHPASIRSYLIVSVLVILHHVFYLRLQTYTTLLEVVSNSVGIGLTSIQSGVAVWLFVIFYKRTKII